MNPASTPSCIGKCWPRSHRARDWKVQFYDAKNVVARAVGLLAERADEVLHGPRATWGPWAKDHRMALAATIMGGS